MFKSARVFWKIYYKDRVEQGSSSYFLDYGQLSCQLNLIKYWALSDDCHVDVDVVFYPANIFEKTVTVMGAL